jgi:hypothetical protein
MAGFCNARVSISRTCENIIDVNGVRAMVALRLLQAGLGTVTLQ